MKPYILIQYLHSNTDKKDTDFINKYCKRKYEVIILYQ